jgi:hypothetical protein
MRIACWLSLILALPGCPESEPDDTGDGDADADADTDADTDADGDADRLDAGPDVPSHPDGGIGFDLGTYSLSLPALVYEPNYPGTPSATLRTCAGEAIKVVAPDFAEEIVRQRRGYLEDGRVIQENGNLDGGGPCYAVMDPALSPWGLGSYGRALEPFKSVFLDPLEAPDRRWLYVPELYGLTMPGAERGLSFVHDGCVRVDDAGAAGLSVGLWATFPSYADEIERLLSGETVELYQDSDYCPGAL